MLRRASMVNASEIEGPLVALDESEDLVVEIEAGVPDQGPVSEDPQHHPAASVFPLQTLAGGGAPERMPREGPAAAPAVFSPGRTDGGFGSEEGRGGEDGGGGAVIPRAERIVVASSGDLGSRAVGGT